MDNHPSFSYPDSTSSTSPCSRETDVENPPSNWEDHPHPHPPSSTTPPPNQKVKFMVSYNGKIQPRTHDNLLSYVGGETKILAVERNINFSTMHSKISSIVNLDASFNDTSRFTLKYQLPGEDLDSLISVTNDDDLEHLMHEYDRLSKCSPKPAKLRIFLFNGQRKYGGSEISSITSSDPGKVFGPDRNQNQNQNQIQNQSNVDFLFGLDNLPVQVPGLVHVLEPDPAPEFNREQVSGPGFQYEQPAMFPTKNDENFIESYCETPSPASIPTSMQFPTGYWQPHQQYHAPPVYMMHAPQQGYYQVTSEQSYGMQPVYSMPAVSTAAPESVGYAQVAYDSVSGRQVYYAAPPQGGCITGAFSTITTAAMAVANGGDGHQNVVAPSSSAGV